MEKDKLTKNRIVWMLAKDKRDRIKENKNKEEKAKN